jgi:hypothetical protein
MGKTLEVNWIATDAHVKDCRVDGDQRVMLDESRFNCHPVL